MKSAGARIRRAGITGLMAASLVALVAPLAHAATWSTSYRYFEAAAVGDRTSNWYAVGTSTQYITQTACRTTAGTTGRIGYDFKRERTLVDDWVAWNSWSCDNDPYTKSYSGIGNGYYYAKIESLPGGSRTTSTLKVYRQTS
ncbi:hypothetical protein ACFW9F_05340 [Streptomyces sp. NPDC059506]|uniref:hypothetical protein n=1 Tax=Streptomyces TaxID=1883 RepID=UPI0022AADE1B|nr:hypothetical protein [Streptomyces sp. HB2AG]MCZ2525657.1 hypothetical protein [Streptomyces sp. HB2AG]